MPEIASVGHGSVGPIDHSNHKFDRSEAAAYARSGPTRPGDRVELSDHARLLDQLRNLPDVRQSRVDEIRRAIAEGTYETPEKLEAAIESLMEELGLDDAEH